MERGTKPIRELLFLHYGVLGAAHITIIGLVLGLSVKEEWKTVMGIKRRPSVVKIPERFTVIKNRTLTYGIDRESLLFCTKYIILVLT